MIDSPNVKNRFDNQFDDKPPTVKIIIKTIIIPIPGNLMGIYLPIKPSSIAHTVAMTK
jgi:hypothetical protein